MYDLIRNYLLFQFSNISARINEFASVQVGFAHVFSPAVSVLEQKLANLFSVKGEKTQTLWRIRTCVILMYLFLRAFLKRFLL